MICCKKTTTYIFNKYLNTNQENQYFLFSIKIIFYTLNIKYIHLFLFYITLINIFMNNSITIQDTINVPSIEDLTLAHLINRKIDHIHAILWNNYRSHQEIADFIIYGNNELNLSANIDELNLTVRSSNALRIANIQTIAHLTQKTEMDLRELPNAGTKVLREIKEVLMKHGLTLRPHDSEQSKISKPTSELLSTSAPRILEDGILPYETCVVKIYDDYMRVVHVDAWSNIEPNSEEEEMVIREFLEWYNKERDTIYDVDWSIVSSQEYIDAIWEYTQKENVCFWDFDTSITEADWKVDLGSITDVIMKAKQWSNFRNK